MSSFTYLIYWKLVENIVYTLQYIPTHLSPFYYKPLTDFEHFGQTERSEEKRVQLVLAYCQMPTQPGKIFCHSWQENNPADTKC